MKLPAVLAALTLAFSAATAPARENAYDVLGKTLAPIVNLFVKETANPNRALRSSMSLLEMTNLPPQFVGSKLDLTLEHPDKLILRGPVLGEPVTLCRNDQELWAAPGTKIQSLINGLGELPKRKKKFKLDDFELPFPEQHLVFLPVLFQVKDHGDQPVNGVTCRVLDVALMPQLAASLNVQEWIARAWIGPDYKLAKLQVARPGWQIIVAMDSMEFIPTLPEETWEPTPAEAADVLKLDPPQFKQILDALKRRNESDKKHTPAAAKPE